MAAFDLLAPFRHPIRRGLSKGVSPRSLLNYMRGKPGRLGFQGVDVSSGDLAGTWRIARDIWLLGEYDLPGFTPQPGWSVVDIGANVGLFSMMAASKGARVRSYEPHPETFEFLRSNTATWGVDCRRAAVVGKPRESVPLYVHPDRDWRNSLHAEEIAGGERLTETVDVPAVPIDEAVDDCCDLLKIDCEGGEFDIFAHGHDPLQRVRRVIGEVHSAVGEPAQAIADLEAAGFEATLHPSRSDNRFQLVSASRT